MMPNSEKLKILSAALDEREIPGHIAQTVVRRARHYPGMRLDLILADFPQIPPSAAAQITARALGCLSLTAKDIQWENVPVSEIEVPPPSAAAVPVRMDNETITLAIVHPRAPEAVAYTESLNLKYQRHSVLAAIADRSVRQRVFKLFQQDNVAFDGLSKHIRAAESFGVNSPKIADELSAIVRETFRAAALLGASDIQFVATEIFGQIQFKIEGTGHIVAEMSRDVYDALMNKVSADFQIPIDSLKEKSTEANVTEHPSLDPEIFRQFNFRCQFTMPESKTSSYIVATIRLLSRNLDVLSFSDAGFDGKHINKIRHITESLAGLVVIVGPVNSGKSTTLFGMLSQVDPIRRLVKTIENPIEFRCPHWEQNELGGGVILTAEDEHNAYRNQIRAMVRKSPDCLLVGEMRSKEEATEIFGLAYASTLCFTSLHAENVANAIGRMRHWGVPAVDLANVLRLIIAQRLVRALCPKCKVKEERPENLAEVKVFQSAYKSDAPNYASAGSQAQIYAARRGGCEFCRHTGFWGRKLIVEMFSHLDEEFKTAVAGNDNFIGERLEKHKASLWHSGMAKVCAGEVSVGEIVRHAGRRAAVS